jgi:hypothetical protein
MAMRHLHEQIKRLSDPQLFELERVVDAEAQRRRKTSAEGIYQGDPNNRIRFWRPCPICHDRACRSQSCRDAERRLAQRRAR